MKILDPDVVLSDYALSLLSFYLFGKLLKNQKKIEAFFFLFSGVSSFLGGTYHGFFPLKTETVMGKTFWMSTLLFLALAANQLWLYLFKQANNFSQRGKIFLGLATLFFLAHALFKDHRFIWGIFYYSLPVLCLGGWLLRSYCRNQEPQKLVGLAAILSLVVASLLQQMGIGVHPLYFDHNALYHLISFGSLWLFYVFFRRNKTC